MANYFYHFLRRWQPHWPYLREMEAELERNQWLSRAELQAVAWRKLKALLDHAYRHVPFYRQQFAALGLTPRDIQTPADFERLPLLTKEEVRTHLDLLIADNMDRAALERVVTSGSTGEPFITYHDWRYRAANVAAFARSRRWFGWEFGDKIAWFWGRRSELPQTFWERLQNQIKQERWMDGFRPTPERIQAFAEELRRWQPELVAGYTNVIYLFARFLAEHHVTEIRPKMVETTAMNLWPHERELIQTVFQCPISDRYGSHESGSVVAAECPLGNRHLFQDFCYVEILANGQPAAAGEPGEVVTTPLYAYGMPLIRFRVGDVAVLDEAECACGRGLPLMRDIVGRVTSLFTLPSGRLLYGGVFRHLVLKDMLSVRRLQVHQYSKEKIEVILERGEGFDDSVVPVVRERCLKLLAGEPVELVITVTDEIPTTASGKHLVTISDVPVNF